VSLWLLISGDRLKRVVGSSLPVSFGLSCSKRSESSSMSRMRELICLFGRTWIGSRMLPSLTEMTSVTEINLGIICNSLIVLRPLAIKVFGDKFATTPSSRNSSELSRFQTLKRSLRRTRDKSNSYRLSSMDEGLEDTARVTTEITVTRSDKGSRVEARGDTGGRTNVYEVGHPRVQRSQYPITKESQYPVIKESEYPIARPSKAYKVLGEV
jgi:hypothetical protein